MEEDGERAKKQRRENKESEKEKWHLNAYKHTSCVSLPLPASSSVLWFSSCAG